MRCAHIAASLALALLTWAERDHSPQVDLDLDRPGVGPIEVDETSALLVIDVQDCFVGANYTSSGKPGSLAVSWKLADQTTKDAGEIIPVVNRLRKLFHEKRGHVIFSQDLHPSGHISFATTHKKEPFTTLKMMCLSPSGADADMSHASCCPKEVVEGTKTKSKRWADALGPLNKACSLCAEHAASCFEMDQMMWPDHCMAQAADGTPGDGATWPKDLGAPIPEEGEVIVAKGTNQFVDAYSAFFDNTKTYQTEMHHVLQGLGVKKIFVVGIAESVCVKETSMDALRMTPAGTYGDGGAYEVYLIEDAAAGLDMQSMSQAKIDMEADKVADHSMHVVSSVDLGV